MTDVDCTSPEFIDVMKQHVPGTEFLLFEVYEIGEALLNWIHTVQTLGHTSPGNTLDYVAFATSSTPAEIVRDFIAWTSGRKDRAPGCEDRLQALISDGRWYDRRTPLMDQLAAMFAPKDQEAS